MVATSFFSRAAVLLSAAPLISALGTAIINNQCSYDVYLWSVSQTSGEMQTLKANGGQYSEGYRRNPDGGGISIKIGRDNQGQNITQYEYTLDEQGLWYDLSLINGYPFIKHGVTVIPADKTCRSVVCPAGIAACAQAYKVPTDNYATAKCGSNTDTVVLLCATEDTTHADPGISSLASSALAATASSTTHKHSTTTQKSTPVHHVTTEAPVHVESAPAAANPNVIVHTTFVTYVVTVEARDAAAEPTPAPIAEPALALAEKRSERRVHRHEHGLQRRHEHAHGHQQEQEEDIA